MNTNHFFDTTILIYDSTTVKNSISVFLIFYLCIDFKKQVDNSILTAKESQLFEVNAINQSGGSMWQRVALYDDTQHVEYAINFAADKVTPPIKGCN
jgi:hypothetical protein